MSVFRYFPFVSPREGSTVSKMDVVATDQDLRASVHPIQSGPHSKRVSTFLPPGHLNDVWPGTFLTLLTPNASSTDRTGLVTDRFSCHETARQQNLLS